MEFWKKVKDRKEPADNMALVRNKGRRLNEYVKDYIVFDLETTGFRPGLDEIIEISAVKVENSEIIDTFSTLVKPSIRIPASATRVNHITNDMVKDAPEIGEALEGFIDFVETGILVGHNIHSFDTNFIYDAAMEVFQEGIYNDYIDTLYMAKNCLPQLKHHKLGDISEYFGISTEGAHRALNDCIMNQKCYEKMGPLLLANLQEPMKKRTHKTVLGKKQIQKIPVSQISERTRGQEMSAEQLWAVLEHSCSECGGMLVKKKGRYGEFWGCGNYPYCRYTRKG